MLDAEYQNANQIDDSETEDNNDLNSSQVIQLQSTPSTVTVMKNKTVQPIEDEFLSEDEETIIIQPETRLITLVGLLERTFNLLDRCRHLVHDMRNIGVVQSFISMEIGKNKRGFTVDMKVRLVLSGEERSAVFADV